MEYKNTNEGCCVAGCRELEDPKYSEYKSRNNAVYVKGKLYCKKHADLKFGSSKKK